MGDKKVDTAKLKEAIKYYGSLEEYIEALRKDKHALENHKKKLTQEVSRLDVNKRSLEEHISNLNVDIISTRKRVQAEQEKLNQYSYQYELFVSFLAMLVSSPSVSDTTESLIALFQSLSQKVWYSPKSLKDLRSLFVITVMGNYLKCYRCTNCETQFIVNKRVDKLRIARNGCPVCGLSSFVIADDSFLKAMISEDQIENVYRTETLIEENNRLKPLMPFLEVKCDICNEPILEWTDKNISRAVEGFGWAHNQCWSSDLGQLKLIGKAVQKIQEGRDKPQTNKEQPVIKLKWPYFSNEI